MQSNMLFISITLVIAFSVISCKSKSERSGQISGPISTNNGFRQIEVQSGGALALRQKVIVRDQGIAVLSYGDGQKISDSALFVGEALSRELLRASQWDILQGLDTLFSNPCVDDGDETTVILKSGDKVKTINLFNYYQSDVARLIDALNARLPDQYKIWYDKKALLSRMAGCELIQE